MEDIAFDGHAQSTCKGLEDAFNFMVLVLTFSTDVEVHGSRITQTLEEMQKHLCWHFANAFTMKFCIPYQPWASTEI